MHYHTGEAICKIRFTNCVNCTASQKYSYTSHPTPDKFENGGFTLKTHQMFSVHTMRRNLKTQQSPTILDLCLRKTRAEESHDYRDVIVFEKLRIAN